MCPCSWVGASGTQCPWFCSVNKALWKCRLPRGTLFQTKQQGQGQLCCFCFVAEPQWGEGGDVSSGNTPLAVGRGVLPCCPQEEQIQSKPRKLLPALPQLHLRYLSGDEQCFNIMLRKKPAHQTAQRLSASISQCPAQSATHKMSSCKRNRLSQGTNVPHSKQDLEGLMLTVSWMQ